jgi:trans-aconitate methyltransferase
MSWTGYFNRSKVSPVRPLLLKALEMYPSDYPRVVLDLGCGVGVDTAHMMNLGFEGTVVEKEIEGIEHLLSILTPEQKEKLKVIHSDFESLTELPVAHFVYASLSLPFCKASHFPQLWSVIEKSFAERCVFAGSFFGPSDTWVQSGMCTGHTEQDIRNMLRSFPYLDIAERNEPGKSALGVDKNWHVFSVIAKR